MHSYYKLFLSSVLTAGFAASTLAADIVIAQTTPLSGPLAPTGSYLKAGAQLYFDAVNAVGGVNGSRIRLISKDDAYKSSETVRLSQELLKNNAPVALFGVVGTGNVEALLKEKILETAGVPLVTVRSGASTITRSNNPWLFVTRASYAEEAAKIIDQYVPLGYKRVAIFYQEDAFGQDVLSSAESLIRQAGGEIAAKGSYEKNTTKVEGAVAAIQAANPHLVLMISNTAASAEFVKQLRAAGSTAQLVTLSTTDAAQVVQKTGAQTARGLAVTQVVPDPNNASVPLSREIRENFQKFGPKDMAINHTFVEGYVGAKVLVEALRRAGPNPTPKKLRDTLEALQDFDAGGLHIGFSPTSHTGSKYVDITIIDRDGKLLR